ncbi:unnamed protein product, partial [Mesorhabditis belari]|uniref:Uncharacterized protein n=1 Tax=Mesorhabditis belari TaxID=2138241 RepID=A0AAF3FGR6_9BILA
MDIFRSIRPTSKLDIYATGDNKIFPVSSDFFTNNYAIGLQVRLKGSGKAIVDPLNDTILLDTTASNFYSHFERSFGCTLNGIRAMIRHWYTSERQIDRIGLQIFGETKDLWHNLPGLQEVELLCDGHIDSIRALKRANGDVVCVHCFRILAANRTPQYLDIYIIRLVPGPKAGLYREYDDVG